MKANKFLCMTVSSTDVLSRSA